MKRCAAITEAKVNAFIPPAISGLGATGGVSFALKAVGDQTPEELSETANLLVSKLMQSGKAFNANTSFTLDAPMINLDIDRDKAEAMNVSVDAVFRTLQTQLGSLYVNDFNMYGKTYKVVIQSEREYRENPNVIGQLTTVSESGALVPMDNLATIKWTLGSRQVERFNMFPATTIRTQAVSSVSSSELMATVRDIVDTELPEGFQISWTDLSYQEVQNEGRIVYLVALAMIFAYLFLVAQYESWTTPISVMLSVVTATLGGMVSLYVAKMPLDIYCQLGLLMLVGLTAKTAILMVEYCKHMREQGLSIHEAAMAGMRVRFRAVMMTALAFTIGVVPLALATGAGAGGRASIGVTVFWGMVAATLVGMVITPGLYVITRHMSETTGAFYKRILGHRDSS